MGAPVSKDGYEEVQKWDDDGYSLHRRDTGEELITKVIGKTPRLFIAISALFP